MNLVKVTYDKLTDMCSEHLLLTGLTPEKALIELRSVNFPAYIYSPELTNTDAYFLMEIRNRLCVKEYAKQSD